jgi:signal transduction histidine kinase
MLSRFDKAGEEIGKEKTDLSELTDRVVEEMRSKAENKGITLEVRLGKTAFANVNQILMSHAIANILDNAIKYSKADTRIRIDTFIRQKEAVIRISDQGIGINEDEITRVQERFYRAKNSSVAKGSGLGLPMCKEIVEKFNGYLAIESKIDAGTTVSIILPLS